MSSPPARFAAIGLGLLTLTLLAACGGGGGDAPTATSPAVPEPTRLPGDLRETGEAPVFWRTVDQFQTVRAGELYKVILRITNGYDEETLSIVAERKGGGGGVELEATLVEPVGDEGPGTFYSFSLKLPKPGNWEVTAVAGDDERSITVQVRPGGPSTRY